MRAARLAADGLPPGEPVEPVAVGPTATSGPLEILEGGRLAGLEPDVLAERFGTPVYVYDLDVVERRVAALRAALPAGFDLAFAVKANPALAVVAHVGGLGVGADVASGGELATALRAGIQASRVVFTGPGKRDGELEAAVAAGIRAITVESPGELERLERIAAHHGRRVPVLLRANATDGTAAERVRLIGDEDAGKFGMDAGDLRACARRAAASPHLDLLGMHAFGASNVLDPSLLAAHVETTVAAAAALASEAGTTLRLVDVGGGLGIPYAEGERPLDLGDLAARLRALADGWADDPARGTMRVLLEPGRFLVGPAGAYIARVVDRKSVDGRPVVILEGGVNHVLRPALVRQPHRVVAVCDAAVESGREASHTVVTVAGPLCTGLDVLARTPMIAPEPGDLVAVLDVGAYGFTESMPLFLSHPTPAEVAVRAGRAELIRPRQEPAEWLEVQRVPGW